MTQDQIKQLQKDGGDCRIPSQNWDSHFANAQLFHHNRPCELAYICPSTTKPAALYFADGVATISYQSIFKNLTKYFYHQQSLDCKTLWSTLKKIKGTAKYKLPLTDGYRALFPLESPEQPCIWLNPEKIYQLEKAGSETLIQMKDGQVLVSPLQIRSLHKAAVQAAYIRSMVYWEFISDHHKEAGPLEVLRLTDAPFDQSLNEEPLLQSWLLQPGEFIQLYQQTYYQQQFNAKYN